MCTVDEPALARLAPLHSMVSHHPSPAPTHPSCARPTLSVVFYFSRLLSASLSFRTLMPPLPLHRAIAVVLLVAVIGSGIDAANLRSGSSEEVRRPPCCFRVVVVLW